MIYKFFEWVKNLTSLAENVVPVRSHVVPFSDKAVCDDVDYICAEEFSDRIFSLNGRWNFAYLSNLKDNSVDVDKIAYKPTELPCSWECIGCEQKQYLEKYPFKYSKKGVEDGKNSFNNVGIYRKKIEICDKSKKYFLNFDRVEGGFEVYINGKYCGFSNLGQAEFDVTDKLELGENEILVAVKKWTVTSLLDGVNRFAESGIVGDVYFVLRNDIFLQDLEVKYNYSDDVNFAGVAEISLSDGSADAEVCLSLEKDGKEIFSVNYPAEKKIEHSFAGDFIPYHNENPALYDLYVTIKEFGQVTECSRIKIGFSVPEILDGVACLAKQPLRIYGVNYNAVYNDKENVMAYEDYRADLKLIAEYGCNTICTKAYLPQKVRRLALTMGLYIVEAVPIRLAKELFALKDNFVANDTQYSDLFLNKALNCYNQSKLDSNVIGYYFEGGSVAPNFKTAISAIKDKTNAFILTDNSDENNIVVIANPTIDEFLDEINKVTASRPVYLADYAPCFGVGNAHLAEFAEIIENAPPCTMGGCISNFVDDCIEGVDMQDYGMFNLKRQPYASAYNQRFIARPIKVKFAGNDRIEIYNNSYFCNLSTWDIVVKVLRNGKVLSKSKLNLTAEPRNSRIVDVFVGHIDGDMYINVECYKKGNDTLVSLEQITLNKEILGIEEVKGENISVEEKFNVVEICFDCGSVRFSKVTGTIIGYCINGKEILNPTASRKGGACFNTKVNRPFARNVNNKKYRVASFETVLFKIEKNTDNVVINVTQKLRFDKNIVYTVKDIYTVKSSGIIDVESSIVPTKKSPHALDCFGKQLRFYPEFEHITYYGKGDTDNYIDMCDYATMGLFDTTATAMKTCAYGQEYGNRTAVHYVLVRNGAGEGLMITAKENPLQIKVSVNSDEENSLCYTKKINVEKSGVYLHVNSAVTGYGSGNGNKPLAKYTLMSGMQSMKMQVYPIVVK